MSAAMFDWEPDVWYTAEADGRTEGEVRPHPGQVWKKGEAEPAKWTIEFEDPNPNRFGAAAITVRHERHLANRAPEALLRQRDDHPQQQEVTGDASRRVQPQQLENEWRTGPPNWTSNQELHP